MNTLLENIIRSIIKEEILSERKNSPKNKSLWTKALNLAKGTKNGGSATVNVDGETFRTPNDSKQFVPNTEKAEVKK